MFVHLELCLSNGLDVQISVFTGWLDIVICSYSLILFAY